MGRDSSFPSDLQNGGLPGDLPLKPPRRYPREFRRATHIRKLLIFPLRSAFGPAGPNSSEFGPDRPCLAAAVRGARRLLPLARGVRFLSFYGWLVFFGCPCFGGFKGKPKGTPMPFWRGPRKRRSHIVHPEFMNFTLCGKVGVQTGTQNCAFPLGSLLNQAEKHVTVYLDHVSLSVPFQPDFWGKM